MASFESFITDDNGDELMVTVEYLYIPAQRGYRNSYGALEEPDYPEDIEIESISDANGDDCMNLATMDEMRYLIEKAWDHHREEN